eukprot:CAMPEP_0202915854 /NCGR_PEP_ID=MMETSP1392-20130828/66889_1 /ASSEMBLY_ACC=CAM_ASM_000868 /TAXON_ID=225041 /ORGANISM="Chlamydomonas chlamydogama, Strain SAG 11-48b" /LENGTH=357 /DNA_ID=CAMNT_0049608047 /DNA_START=29 /DNA_END=1098 /DNA_ORIENTATION=-
MDAKPLEGGRYFVLWPRMRAITAGGQPFVVDPYGRGGLLLASEVCELFEVKAEELWRPASNRQLLAALLGDLRDSHWARAVGCSPTPASMVPLSLDTALANKASVVNPHSARRALAAAEKRLWLLPDDRAAHLELALLHYFTRNYDDAWIELGIMLEQHSSSMARLQQQQEVSSSRQQRWTPSDLAAAAAVGAEALPAIPFPFPSRVQSPPASSSAMQQAPPSTSMQMSTPTSSQDSTPAQPSQPSQHAASASSPSSTDVGTGQDAGAAAAAVPGGLGRGGDVAGGPTTSTRVDLERIADDLVRQQGQAAAAWFRSAQELQQAAAAVGEDQAQPGVQSGQTAQVLAAQGAAGGGHVW